MGLQATRSARAWVSVTAKGLTGGEAFANVTLALGEEELADGRLPAGLKPKAVVRVDQLVVALPLTAIALNNAPYDPAVLR